MLSLRNNSKTEKRKSNDKNRNSMIDIHTPLYLPSPSKQAVKKAQLKKFIQGKPKYKEQMKTLEATKALNRVLNKGSSEDILGEMQNILVGKEDIQLVLEKARKEAMLSLKNYNDKSYAKIKNNLYDLDEFILKFSDKQIEGSIVKQFQGDGYDQRRINNEVFKSLKELSKGIKEEIDFLKRRRSMGNAKTNSVKNLKLVKPEVAFRSTRKQTLVFPTHDDLSTMEDQIKTKRFKTTIMLPDTSLNGIHERDKIREKKRKILKNIKLKLKRDNHLMRTYKVSESVLTLKPRFESS